MTSWNCIDVLEIKLEPELPYLNSMEKSLSLCVPTETLHCLEGLESLNGGSMASEFLIDRVEQSQGTDGSNAGVLISASLFNDGTRLSCPSKMTPLWFADHVIAGPREQYFDPLNARRRQFGNSRLRLYVSRNLESLIPWFFDLGIDEVFVMAVEGAGFMPGMLWRYLAITERKFEWVACTGIDDLGVLGQQLQSAHRSASASLHPARFWMPFAGPFAISPAYLQEVTDIAVSMSGFLDLWKQPDLTTFVGQILRRCNQPANSRYCDAAFLSMCFWNRKFLRSNPRLFLLDFLEFAQVHIAPIRLGESEE